MKALCVEIIDLDIIFRFVKGRCHGNQLMLGASNELRLIPPVFLHSSPTLDERISSGDDETTSCKNVVNFCMITPDMIELICVIPASGEN